MASEVLTIGDGDRAMLPMEALSSSTEGTEATRSDGSGLILILNFFLWSSSPSDSSEEKKWGFLMVGGSAASRKEFTTLNEGGPGFVKTSLTMKVHPSQNQIPFRRRLQSDKDKQHHNISKSDI